MGICKIEHQAMIFAFMAKEAVERCGEKGKESILRGMTLYGNERGRRMALNAKAHGEEINTLTNQAFGEWTTDYPGQMEFGQIQIEPTLQTYISKCAWCDAWAKHGISKYGKLYCVNVDNAVYQGYQDKYACTPITEAMSWGGECCKFDWGCALSEEENARLKELKAEIGTTYMKDFDFHTAHMMRTISKVLVEDLGAEGEAAVEAGLAAFEELYGAEYLEAAKAVPEKEL